MDLRQLTISLQEYIKLLKLSHVIQSMTKYGYWTVCNVFQDKESLSLIFFIFVKIYVDNAHPSVSNWPFLSLNWYSLFITEQYKDSFFSFHSTSIKTTTRLLHTDANWLLTSNCVHITQNTQHALRSTVYVREYDCKKIE